MAITPPVARALAGWASVPNGGFETGDFTYWVVWEHPGISWTVEREAAYSGNFGAKASASTSKDLVTGEIHQFITETDAIEFKMRRASSRQFRGSTEVGFYSEYGLARVGFALGDYALGQALHIYSDLGETWVEWDYYNWGSPDDWHRFRVELSGGTFSVYVDDHYAGSLSTTMGMFNYVALYANVKGEPASLTAYFDDVLIRTGVIWHAAQSRKFGVSIVPVGWSGIFNGGFETGNFTNWDVEYGRVYAGPLEEPVRPDEYIHCIVTDEDRYSGNYSAKVDGKIYHQFTYYMIKQQLQKSFKDFKVKVKVTQPEMYNEVSPPRLWTELQVYGSEAGYTGYAVLGRLDKPAERKLAITTDQGTTWFDADAFLGGRPWDWHIFRVAIEFEQRRVAFYIDENLVTRSPSYLPSGNYVILRAGANGNPTTFKVYFDDVEAV